MWAGFIIGLGLLAACSGNSGDEPTTSIVVPISGTTTSAPTQTTVTTGATLDSACVPYQPQIIATYQGAGEAIDVTDAAAVEAQIAAGEEALRTLINDAADSGCQVTGMGLDPTLATYLLTLTGNTASLDANTQELLDNVLMLGRNVAEGSAYPSDLIQAIAVEGGAGYQFTGADETVNEVGLVSIWTDQRSVMYVSYSESGTCWAVEDNLESVKKYLKSETVCSAQQIVESGLEGSGSWTQAINIDG